MDHKIASIVTNGEDAGRKNELNSELQWSAGKKINKRKLNIKQLRHYVNTLQSSVLPII